MLKNRFYDVFYKTSYFIVFTVLSILSIFTVLSILSILSILPFLLFYRFYHLAVFTILTSCLSRPESWPTPLPPIFFNKPHNDKTARPLGKNLRSWAVVKTHPPCGFLGGGVPRFRGGPGGWFWGVRKFGGRCRIWGGGTRKVRFGGRSDKTFGSGP